MGILLVILDAMSQLRHPSLPYRGRNIAWYPRSWYSLVSICGLRHNSCYCHLNVLEVRGFASCPPEHVKSGSFQSDINQETFTGGFWNLQRFDLDKCKVCMDRIPY